VVYKVLFSIKRESNKLIIRELDINILINISYLYLSAIYPHNGEKKISGIPVKMNYIA
jgi:hypothetical protein